MVVPSGKGNFPSRYALIATSLPIMAPKLLRLPSSWAREITLQSRYPGGILVTKIGAASPSALPDGGVMRQTTLAADAIAASKKIIRFMRYLLLICKSCFCLASHENALIRHKNVFAPVKVPRPHRV